MLKERGRMFAVLAGVWLVKAPFYLLAALPLALLALLDWASSRLDEADYYSAVLRRRRRWAAIRKAANNKESNT
jgi:hypothetical protein